MEDFNEYYSKLNSINTGKEEIENESNQLNLAKEAREHAIGGVEEALGFPLSKEVIKAGVKKVTQTAIDSGKKAVAKAGSKLKDALRNKKPSTNDDTQDGSEQIEMKEMKPQEEPSEEAEEEPTADELEEEPSPNEAEGLDDDEGQDDADAPEEMPEETPPIGQEMVPDGAGDIGPDGLPNSGGMSAEEASKFTQNDDAEASERTGEDEARTGDEERTGDGASGADEEEQANKSASKVEQEATDADEAVEESGDGAVSGLTDALEASTATDETGVGDLVSGAIGLGLMFASFGEMFKHHHTAKPTIASASTQFGV